jgi:hypothetical protein
VFDVVPKIDTSPSIAWRSLIPRLRTASRIAFGDREAAAHGAVLDPALNSERLLFKRSKPDPEHPLTSGGSVAKCQLCLRTPVSDVFGLYNLRPAMTVGTGERRPQRPRATNQPFLKPSLALP